MATSTNTKETFRDDIPSRTSSPNAWLKNPRWDLSFIIFSIVLVPIPYLVWIFMGQNTFGRQFVNFTIAVMIGGPHMVATFSRTTFDKSFRAKYPKFIASTFIIPIVVITLALTNMSLLLTVFFSIAALHVIHQAIYIVESYNRKERDPKYEDNVMKGQMYSWKESLTSPYYLIDFLVIATALFPKANAVMVEGNFQIGQTSLNAAIPSFFEQMWTVYLASAVFGLSALAFLIKSFLEFRASALNVPKFLFIFATATALFTGPFLGNLDTSFQGINVWHSFQYLALTWYAIQLRNKAKKSDDYHPQQNKETLLDQILESGSLKKFYGFNFLLTAVIGVVILVVFGLLSLAGGVYSTPSYAFEVAYYIGVLSVLWMHYYHDHFLFTQTDSLVP